MTHKRMLMQMGMGTDLQGQDYTKAAVRGLQDAIRHNSISVAPAFGYAREAMHVVVQVGVAQPDKVDVELVAAVLPYGTSEINAVHGGLDVVSDDGSNTIVLASVAAIVYLDMDEN